MIKILGNGAIAIALQNKVTSKHRILINCAGIPHPDKVNPDTKRRETTHLKNVIASHNDFDKIVHVSSPAVLGEQESHLPESFFPVGRLTEYGKFKRTCEQRLHDNLGEKLLILRLFSYTSKDLKKQIVYDTFKKIQAGDFSFLLDENQRRSFVSEVDFVRMAQFSLDKNLSGIVNCTNSSNVLLTDVVKAIFNFFHVNQDPIFLPTRQSANYSNLYSDFSTLFDLGFKLNHVGVEAVLDTVSHYEN